MGASSSSLQSKKEIGGIIDVGENKKKVIQAMDLLFQQLLTATNPINFKQALEATGNGTCSGILVLLGPTIETEFQKLAFEDPATKQIVKSVFKGYDSIDDFSSTALTRTMCKEITLFFLRLIILVGTCVVSIRPNKAMTGLLGTIGSSMVEASKEFQGIVKLKLKTIKSGDAKLEAGAERKADAKPDSEEILFSKLIEDPKDFQLKKIIGAVLKNDSYSVVKRTAGPYSVVVYKAKEYVIDLANLVVYTNQTDTAKQVGVISISGAAVDPPEKKEEPKRGGTRRSPRERTRYTRKLRGGGPEEVYYYLFNRTNEGCSNSKPVRAACSSTSSEEKRITMNTKADEFVKEVIEYYLKQFDGSVYAKEQIDKVGAKIEPVSGTGAKVTGYDPLTLNDKETYARLQNLLESGEVGKLEEGTCFAVYRAYLLASGLTSTEKGPMLKTYVCHDKWATSNTSLNSLPLFALLEQLYKDRFGTSMEAATAEKYNTFISRLTQIGTLAAVSGADQTFKNLTFKPITNDSLYCKKAGPGLEPVDDTTVIDTVMNQFKLITASLEKLIDDITNVLNKIIDFPLFIKETRIKLRPIFVDSKNGAPAVLSEFINETRTLLENHIIEVETAYYEGFTAITNQTDSLLAEAPTIEDPTIKGLLQ